MYVMTSATWDDAEANADDHNAKDLFAMQLNPDFTLFKHRKDAMAVVEDMKHNLLDELRELEESSTIELTWRQEDVDDIVTFIATRRDGTEYARIRVAPVEVF